MIFETIKNVLIKELDLEPEIISEDAMLVKDLELDSTENVIISLELRKKYGVDFVFPKNDVSLKDICNIVESMLAQKQSA